MSNDAGAGPPVTLSREAFLALAREVLARQPFSVLLGAEIVAIEPGCCEIALALDERLKQQHGFAHGGVLAYLADNALTYAGGTAMRVPVVTAEMKINYVRPAIGERLVARAQALATGRSQSVCRCEVYAISAGEEKLVALAQATIAHAAQKDAPR